MCKSRIFEAKLVVGVIILIKIPFELVNTTPEFNLHFAQEQLKQKKCFS